MSSRALGGAAPLLLVTLLAAAVAGGGCKRSARTAAEARARLAEAVKDRDGEKLYAALDLPTRWSWMTVRRAHREAYDIILSNFPEGAERERQIARFEAGALSVSEAALFAEQMTPARWQELDRQLTGPAEKLPLGKGEDGSWGYAGYDTEGEDRKRRASADLELMRTTAADFEKAAARSGK
jgi:hypothetical protein